MVGRAPAAYGAGVSGYLHATTGFDVEIDRLRLLERRYDAVSFRRLGEFELLGARCLEVGASEGGAIANACALGGLHLSEDLHIVEPVDHDGAPVPPGTEAAKVLLTNLYNHALRLIRYELTDQVRILAESCRCGSARRSVADLQGRLDDHFDYGGFPSWVVTSN